MTEAEITEIKKLQEAYRGVFGTDSGTTVLKHLRETCFGIETTFRGNKDEALVHEGQRRVLLSIENMLKLNIDELVKSIGGSDDNG